MDGHPKSNSADTISKITLKFPSSRRKRSAQMILAGRLHVLPISQKAGTYRIAWKDSIIGNPKREHKRAACDRLEHRRISLRGESEKDIRNRCLNTGKEKP